MYVLGLVAQLLSDSLWPPWTVDHQAPLSIKFSRQEYWSGLPLGSSPTRDWTKVSHISGRFFTFWATREAQPYVYEKQKSTRAQSGLKASDQALS